MDGLELRVHQADLHQQREIILCIEERLERTHRRDDLGGRRRDERRLRQRATRGPNPVLAPPQFARCQVRPANAAEQLGVDFTNQANRQRQLLEPAQPVVHGPNVVDDLRDVRRGAVAEHSRLDGQQVLEGALRSLNLAREHGLLADVHVDEQVRVRKRLDRSVKTTQCPVGLRQPTLQFKPEVNGRRGGQGRRDERPVANRLSDVRASASSARSFVT